MQKLTREILKSSDIHFSDAAYLCSLIKRPELVGRKKRKIKTIALYYWRMHNGGTERVTSMLASLWCSLEYRVILLTDELPSSSDYYYSKDVERLILPSHKCRYMLRGTTLAQILEREQIDVFISNQWFELATIWDMLIAKSLGIPVIIGWHNVFDAGIYDGENIDQFKVRLNGYRYADLVTVLSTVDQFWFTSNGYSARLVHNPVCFSLKRSETVAPLTSKTILWIGRVERHQKRIDHAIRMLAVVLQQIPDVKLLVVGDGPDRIDAIHLANSLGIAEHIKFTGYANDVNPYIERAALHVMTSQFEGAPMVLNEVWAHGVPTVMYDLPYLEYVRARKGFISVEQNNVESLAKEVVKVLKNDELRKKLGAEARAVSDSFFAVNLAAEWQSIFHDLETCDDMGRQLTQEGIARVAPIIGHQLLEKLYAVDDRAKNYQLPAWLLPLVRMRRLAGRIRRRASAILRSAWRIIQDVGEWRPSTRFVPLKTVDFSQVGLGDNLMLWSGLYTLLDHGHSVCASDCIVYVPHELRELCAHIFARFRLQVHGGQPVKEISPFFTPLPPRTMLEGYKTYLGIDWRMNWVEALDRQKTFPRLGVTNTWKTRLRLRVSEYILYKRSSWRAARPEYIGYRVWYPVARKLGLNPMQFVHDMQQSLTSLRQVVSAYVDTINASSNLLVPDTAIFPCGKSFQSIIPSCCNEIKTASREGTLKFYIQNNDPWLERFINAGITPENLESIDSLLKIIKSAKKVVTTDSFSSHVAQFLRDDFTLILTRDLRENVVHPGARPHVIANHPGCAPCNYHGRTELSTCLAGYSHCIAFDKPDFVNKIVRASQR